MSQIEDNFNNSLEIIKSIVQFTDINEKTFLYKYYKQATEGDINYSKPTGLFNILAVKKWEEWNSLKGITKDNAKKIYTEFVNKLEIKYKK